MPEEHNRVVADHLSDLCLAPTDLNVANLRAEGIPDDVIVKTGNPVTEAVERLMPTEDDRASLLLEYGLEREEYVLATFHRPENVDGRETLENVLLALSSLDVPVLLPLHPRTQQRIADFDLSDAAGQLQIVDPIGYRDFIGLGAESRLIISDSGGVQEEVSVYKRPAVVIRRSTERQEVEGTFVQRFEPGPALASQLAQEVDRSVERAAELSEMPSPYGDAQAPQRSVEAIRTLVERSS
jgi:UDP-N-acetylglucosamine 2-epimerase (non-hydrolysing)